MNRFSATTILILFFFSIHLLVGATEINNSISAQLEIAQNLSQKGQAQASLDAIHFAQQAAINYSHGNECIQSCPYGCCDSGSGLIYEGGLFMLLNTQANLLEKTFELSAQQACNSYNTISTKPKNCSAEIKTLGPLKPESAWYDEKGNCKSSAPAECALISSLPGAKIFGQLANDCRKNSTCQSDFYSTYKPSSEGAIELKLNNKKTILTMDSFKDAKYLKSAGLSSEEVDYLMKKFEQIQKLTASKKEINGLISNSVVQNSSHTGLNAITVTTSATNSLTEANQKAQKPELLTVNYNGERIHISNVDIFAVISIRYQTNLNSFLQPE